MFPAVPVANVVNFLFRHHTVYTVGVHICVFRRRSDIVFIEVTAIPHFFKSGMKKKKCDFISFIDCFFKEICPLQKKNFCSAVAT